MVEAAGSFPGRTRSPRGLARRASRFGATGAGSGIGLARLSARGHAGRGDSMDRHNLPSGADRRSGGQAARDRLKAVATGWILTRHLRPTGGGRLVYTASAAEWCTLSREYE